MPRLRVLHGFDVVTPFLGACDRCKHTVTNVRVVASTIEPMRAPDQACVDHYACDLRRQANREQAIRCFDRNGGRSFDLPRTDPHGRAWLGLTEEELSDRAGWCMLPEFHEALGRAWSDRRHERVQRRAEMRDELIEIGEMFPDGDPLPAFTDDF